LSLKNGVEAETDASDGKRSVMSCPPSRLLVLPNRNSLGLFAVLIAMWYAGAGQNNGAAYLLCFTVAGIAAVSAVHAWANLRGITLRAGMIAPVFAGETLLLPLHANAKAGRRHTAIVAHVPGNEGVTIFEEISGEHPVRGELYVKERKRGHFESLTVRVHSLYPLGFFTARQTFELYQTHFVYPRPFGDLPLPAAFDPASERNAGARTEGDDFAGVREWQPGESMRHVDWKAVARGQPVMIKQWSGVAGDLLVLEWEALPHLGLEEKLCQLAQWAITAEKAGATYDLRLPGFEIDPGRGESHFHACMRALASYHPEQIDAPGNLR